MEQEWIKAKELAEMWAITPRRVNQLCADNQLPGVYKVGKSWRIPADVQKPFFLRESTAEYTASRNKSSGLLPCPVGITSYKKVTSECYYIDKTLLIRDLIDDRSQVFLFTRPRRFGKTLAMDMVRTYFEKTDEDTSIYFSDKKIWLAGKKYRDYHGKYPVIFLSFKDTHQVQWETTYESLCFTIIEEFKRHMELLYSPILNEYDKRFFQKIIDGDASFVEFQFALGKLSSMLSLHYSEKVIVIIDEYDTPIQQGYLNGYYDQVVGFMRNLFSSVLKDNHCLEFGILTGILRVAKESLFSGLNNLVVNTILDIKYTDYFGFTEKEVDRMCVYYHMSEKKDEIKNWYDGYLFGTQEIYNPWSVINYFNNNCKPKAFWSRTSGNEIIGHLIQNANPEIADSLSLLLQGKEIQSLINTDIIYPEIDADSDIIYSFLVVSGYLKIKETISEFLDTPICSLVIPNKEIKSIFQREILDKYSSLFHGSLLRDFEMSLRIGNEQLFTDTLQKYLLRSVSSFDTAHENFYHGMVLGMLAIMSDNYYISSNRKSGEGRFDIQLEPKMKNQIGYLIEFKAGKDLSQDELNSLAEDAILQIRKKQYAADMEYHEVKKIGVFGIAFCGKHVAANFEWYK